MSNKSKFVDTIANAPQTIIEMILASALVLYGAYLFSPVYEASNTTALGILFDLPLLRILVGGFYLLSGIIGIVGAITKIRTTRSIGTYAMFASYFFTSMLRLLVIGPIPVLWVFTLALALVCAVLNINLKWGENGGD